MLSRVLLLFVYIVVMCILLGIGWDGWQTVLLLLFWANGIFIPISAITSCMPGFSSRYRRCDYVNHIASRYHHNGFIPESLASQYHWDERPRFAEWMRLAQYLDTTIHCCEGSNGFKRSSAEVPHFFFLHTVMNDTGCRNFNHTAR